MKYKIIVPQKKSFRVERVIVKKVATTAIL